MSLPGQATAGDLIVVSTNWFSQAATATVSDSAGNTYHAAMGPTNWFGTNNRAQLFYAKNIRAGATSVTVTLNGGSNSGCEVYIEEYSGVDRVSPLDQVAAAAGSQGQTPSSGARTTTQANELVFGYAESADSIGGPGAGFTARSTFDQNLVEDKIVSTIGSHAATFASASSDWIAAMATFKAAGGTGTTDAGTTDTGAADSAGDASGSNDSGAGSPLIYAQFHPTDFNGTTSIDGLWHIAGPWVGTGNNYLNPANAVLTESYGGSPGGYLLLSVVPTASHGSCNGAADSSNPCQGAEIQTAGTTPIAGSSYNGSNLRYGYYEVRMKVTNTPGGVASFFWKEVNYGQHEIDYEFLTNASWVTDPTQNGVVMIGVLGGPEPYPQPLTFNPTTGFHRYGFLWTPAKVEWVIDGQSVFTYTTANVPAIPSPNGGYIMMNTWTGNPNYGGGPPTAREQSAYDWVKFWPDVTSVPE